MEKSQWKISSVMTDQLPVQEAPAECRCADKLRKTENRIKNRSVIL